jgi:hypothetical protein
MGNNSSRGAYPPQYPPKHAYYSERRGHKPRKGGGGGFRYPNGADYEHQQRYPSHSRYPHYSGARPLLLWFQYILKDLCSSSFPRSRIRTCSTTTVAVSQCNHSQSISCYTACTTATPLQFICTARDTKPFILSTTHAHAGTLPYRSARVSSSAHARGSSHTIHARGFNVSKLFSAGFCACHSSACHVISSGAFRWWNATVSHV